MHSVGDLDVVPVLLYPMSHIMHSPKSPRQYPGEHAAVVGMVVGVDDDGIAVGADDGMVVGSDEG